MVVREPAACAYVVAFFSPALCDHEELKPTWGIDNSVQLHRQQQVPSRPFQAQWGSIAFPFDLIKAKWKAGVSQAEIHCGKNRWELLGLGSSLWSSLYIPKPSILVSRRGAC